MTAGERDAEDQDPEGLAALEGFLRGLRPEEEARFEGARFLTLRLLGLIYGVGFLILVIQRSALIGSQGLLPARLLLEDRIALEGGRAEAFLSMPTLFLYAPGDASLGVAAWLGLGLSVAVLFGLSHPLPMALLWALYLSFVHVGQIFYGYGWEILLLEAGFLAIFLSPLRSVRPFPRERVPAVAIWLFRWLCFRVMFGAGLIKLRGDRCWRELSCLETHYETQPIPSPLSWLLHQAPAWLHALGVAFNHYVELIAPFLLLLPQRIGGWRTRGLRHVGAASVILFQLLLILSGNLSFLNWLTIAVAVPALDDRLLARLLPSAFRAPLRSGRALAPPSRARRGLLWALALLVGLLSLDPALNLLSPRQSMNASFDRLHLVNTYGAFGSVNRERREVILEGTLDDPRDPGARWREYELPCKPGPVDRPPCLITPYHLRLDWQMWFAALGRVEQNPWLVHLAYQLLHARPEARSLLSRDPFYGRRPRAVRAELYRYRFTRLGEGSSIQAGWWRRHRLGPYLRPLTADDPELLEVVRGYGWPALE